MARAADILSSDVTVADFSNFNILLPGQTWDLLLVDCPSTTPNGGWGDVINYVNGGGEIVMSFWDWDNDGGWGDPILGPAFGFTSAITIYLEDGVSRLYATNTAEGDYVFCVPGMPHSRWSNFWFDDGDAFGFTGGAAIAYLSGYTDPVVIENGAGNAIAAFLIDEWSGDGAVDLWVNLAHRVLGDPSNCHPIPTITEWGMIILVLFMVASRILYISRKRKVV